MSDRILAAVMVAPDLPIDVLEFDAADLPMGSGCGLLHAGHRWSHAGGVTFSSFS